MFSFFGKDMKDEEIGGAVKGDDLGLKFFANSCLD